MKKILFIDDEKDLHSMMNIYFPKDQYRLICAHDGLEGMQKFRNEDFDLIILDYKMPKLDGAKFFRQIREIQESKKVESTPVIFVSGNIDELKNLNIKFDKCEFLPKPFTKEDLYQKVSAFREKTRPAIALKTESKISLNPGEKLFTEEEEGTCMYFVLSGILEGSRKTSDGKITSVGQIGPGEIVGEMAIINNQRRVLTITAVEKSELLMIPAEKILAVINNQPKWIKVMIETISKRLLNTLKRTS